MQSVQPCIVWVYSCIVTLIGTQSDLTLHNVVTFSKLQAFTHSVGLGSS